VSSEELTYQKIWNTLSSVDCNEHTDKKGGLTYLSWAWAWAMLMEHYPTATFEFSENEIHADGSMTVNCTVTIGECQRSMWLPVMDYKNAAIKSPNARDISDNKMRCLTKTLSLLGLGHYIYSGEDIPSSSKQPAKPKAESKKTPAAKEKPKNKQQTASEQPKTQTTISIRGKEWTAASRMEAQKKAITIATPENIENVMNFIFDTILHFALPPEGSSTKESDPKTVEGWINQFTDNDDNKKTLVELYNAGFKNEVQDLKKRLKPLCELASIEEYYKSLNEQKEK